MAWPFSIPGSSCFSVIILDTSVIFALHVSMFLSLPFSMRDELSLSCLFLSGRLIHSHWSMILTQCDGGYTALNFALHDSHVLNTNVFMRPLGRVGINYIAYSYTISIYSGARVTDVP